MIIQLQTILMRFAKHGVLTLCLVNALSMSAAWGANPSRPNVAQARPSVQRSVLPTQPTGPKGEVGGANTGVQKSTASVGGPSVGAAPAQSSTKSGLVKPDGGNNPGKSTSTPK